MSRIRHSAVGWEWEKGWSVTQGTLAGDYLWLAGQTAMDSDGTVVGEGDWEVQVRKVFSNIAETLAVFEAQMEDVVHLTQYFVPVMSEEMIQAFWAVRREFFSVQAPSSTGIQVAGLAKPEMLLEVEAVAFVGGR
ncbi:Rid family hydrolase [Sphingobium fuliginis]|uniref:RidA family protein n=1 Tax=Sphingobium fuliginis ATCC 27551 TaxID=1208342 RepID=A0A5B8CP47_SPHSA|nr:Rid family hydrolase [Sphingobium fuliginis]QDC40424.1 RidA family protein [Sphingobium fuliginis ATCC 27551]